MPDHHGPAVCLFGAALDTGNLGVSALGMSTLAALTKRIPSVRFVLFDHGRGTRSRRLRIGDQDLDVELRGGHISRRVYRRESLWSMYAASRYAPAVNANVRAIRDADLILDISGGDSFTDLYGKKQLDLVTLPKLIALALGRPLILLPQMYGPFRYQESARRATDLLTRTTQAWARDAEGFGQLRSLLGDRFDPGRHRQGVDVAFALPATEPTSRTEPAGTWLEDGLPVIGINLSGLLYNDPVDARERFGLATDYRETMLALVEHFMRETDVRVLLVPHVHGGGNESDVAAAEHLLAHVDQPTRLAKLHPGLGADEVKYIISQLDWFLGARMHSTIAALSTRTPVAAIAYSDKFAGVFDGCGVGHRVIDARRVTAPEMITTALEAWSTSSTDRTTLASGIVEVEAIARAQFDSLAATISGSSERT